MGSHKRGLLKGNKFNGKHSTVIKAAEPIVALARELRDVTKIVIGKIESLGSGGGAHLQVRPAPPAGIKVIVSGGGAVQTIYLYTPHPALTEQDVKAAWRERER